MPKRISESQKLYINNNYNNMKLLDIAEHTKLTVQTIIRYVKKNIGLKNHKFNDDELIYITDNFKHKSIIEIANILHCKRGSVSAIGRRMGFKKRQSNHYTSAEIKLIKDNCHKKTAKEIAIILGRNLNGVYRMYNILGINNLITRPINKTIEKIIVAKEPNKMNFINEKLQSQIMDYYYNKKLKPAMIAAKLKLPFYQLPQLNSIIKSMNIVEVAS